MGLGLEVAGIWDRSHPSSIHDIEVWIKQHYSSLLRDSSVVQENGTSVLLFGLHPAAEDLRIAVGDAQIRVSAQTSAAGPGYHLFVCALLRRLERECGIRWQPSDDDGGDETGYFESGDEAVVYREMLAWLGALCNTLIGDQEFSEGDEVATAMPIGTAYRGGEFLVTQMGPRSRLWAESVARDSSIGSDFFPWWNLARDASFHRNRALCLMWTDVRWRPPLTDQEKTLLTEIDNDLSEACRLDPALPLPWREWQEIRNLLGKFGSLPHAGSANGTPTLIGYRRRPVVVSLTADWSIQIPGEFGEAWDADDTWSAWDQTMTVWVTTFSSRKEGSDTHRAAIISGFEAESDDIVDYEDLQLLSKGSIRWVEREDGKYWQLHARMAADGQFAFAPSVTTPKLAATWPSESGGHFDVNAWRGRVRIINFYLNRDSRPENQKPLVQISLKDRAPSAARR